MSGLDKDRLRNQTVSFRVSPEERQRLEARIKVSGLHKGKSFIRFLLHGKIDIIVGKNQSDRLSLEIRRLREQIGKLSETDEKSIVEPLKACEALLAQLLAVMEVITPTEAIKGEDFAKEK